MKIAATQNKGRLHKLSLRDYQKDCIDAINKSEAQGIRKQLISIATGGGKTVVFASLIAQRNQKALILAHSFELLQQSQDKLKMVAPDLSAGLVYSEKKEFGAQVVICSIQSAILPENLSRLKSQEFQIVIIDEAHRTGGDSYKAVLEALKCNEPDGPLLLGFTATAFRNDSKGLGEIFDKVTFELGISELIKKGYLVKPTAKRILSDIDLSLVQTSSGDYDAQSLSQVMDTDEMIGAVVDSYEKHAKFLSTICFSCSIAHSENLAKEFLKRGYQAASVSGKTPKDQRESILKSFSSGGLDILCNCSILTEGIDIPRAQCCLIARPTQSKILFIQMAGRILRLYPNKTRALIIDFGNVPHSLIGKAELVKDAEVINTEEETFKARFKELMETYPTKLNQRLKLAAINAELLSEEDGFVWSKDFKGRFFLKSHGNELLRIDPQPEDKFSVRLYNGSAVKEELASRMDFDYAFSIANEHVEKNRERFTLGDLKAPWRDQPASSKQIDLLKKYRFSNGLDGLTRGQAALVISSGALRRTG